MTTITLFYTDNLAAHYGIGPEPSYTKVYSFVAGECDHPQFGRGAPTDDDLALCEAVFAWFNRGSGREHSALDRERLRSLSVGDIVKLADDNGSRSYRCESMGFAPIESWKVAAK